MEQTHKQPPQELIDANTASRTLSDAELLKTGAVILNGSLSPTSTQMEDIAAAHTEVSASRPLEPETKSKAEHDDSHEALIDNVVRTSAIAANNIWLRRDDVPSQYFKGYGGSMFSTIINKRARKPSIASPLKTKTFGKIKEEFVAQHVSELVTVTPLTDTKFADFDRDSAAASEEAVMVKYEPLSDQSSLNSPYRWRAHKGAPGQGLNLAMIMPMSLAQKLTEAIQQEPKVVRELMDTIMSREFEAGEAWKEFRPPFEDWQAANDGVNRIALRTDMSARVDTSQVLEF